MKSSTQLRILTVILLSLLPTALPGFHATHAQTISLGSDPLGSISGTSSSAVFWSDAQKINNTSFETGNFQPWVAANYNPYASGVLITSPGYNDNHAVQLSITSGNLTSSSYQRLTQDLSSSRAVFSNNVLLQASVQVTTLTGNSSSDRAGIILNLATSTGSAVQLHYVFNSGAPLPANTTSDGYFKVAGFGSPGWIHINRTVASDAQSVFPSFYQTINTVKSVNLYVDSMSYGNVTRDPRITFFDGDGDTFWNATETAVYNTEMDGIYHTGDQTLYQGSTYNPAPGSPLTTDPRIKYVDLNNNRRWDNGEPIVYDCNNPIPSDCNNNVYDVNEPTLYGNPIVGQLLMDPIRRVTTASFDQVELVAPMSTGNLVINSGFETGTLSGWANSTGFSISNSAQSGSYSAFGTTTTKTIQLGQSLDSEPLVDPATYLLASTRTSTLTGTTANDMVDVWLGLSDSRGAPLSLSYVFDTGNGQIPSNSKGSVYYKVAGFGTSSQWVGINRTLTSDTAAFTVQGFSPPYTINVVALELRAQSGISSANFDNISLHSAYSSSLNAPFAYDAVDRQNATYTYTVSRVPRAYFSLQIPAGQTVLKVTAPDSTILQSSDYNVTNFSAFALVNIPNSTGTRYLIGGIYSFDTTSRNAVGTVYLQDPSTQAVLDLTKTFDPGRRASIVGLSIDPFATGISGANSTISIWLSNGTMAQSWNGLADGFGFFRVSNIGLPLSNGTYTLQATSYSIQSVGVRTTHFFVLVTSPAPSSFIWIIILVVAIVAGLAGFLFFWRRRKTRIIVKKQPSTQQVKPGKSGGPPAKKGTSKTPPRKT